MRTRWFLLGGMRVRGALATVVAVALAAIASACGGGAPGPDGPLVVFNAGSLARPIRAALDTFARREGVRVAQE
ncbi:MAG: hypothetical protein JNK70_14080, partial [Phycisphaerae bacterium]|nr:hypothetical protein [Phycisphaerae bacterium]